MYNRALYERRRWVEKEKFWLCTSEFHNCSSIEARSFSKCNKARALTICTNISESTGWNRSRELGASQCSKTPIISLNITPTVSTDQIRWRRTLRPYSRRDLKDRNHSGNIKRILRSLPRWNQDRRSADETELPSFLSWRLHSSMVRTFAQMPPLQSVTEFVSWSKMIDSYLITLKTLFLPFIKSLIINLMSSAFYSQTTTPNPFGYRFKTEPNTGFSL